MAPSPGRFVSRAWLFVLIGWAAVLVGSTWLAPRWDSVAEEGEFAFLPESAESRVGDRLLKRAFPDDSATSSIVVVARREGGAGLTGDDRAFLARSLRPGLDAIAKESVGRASASGASPTPVVSRILTPDDPVAGPLLVSEDNRAALVIVELTTEFRDTAGRRVVEKAEGLIDRLRAEGRVPAGLDLGLTGGAAVGRDLSVARNQSADVIEQWTIWIIVGLLVVIYRAPLVAILPLVCIVASMTAALNVYAMLGRAGVVGIFRGLEVYATVIVYGSGVDYCLFLIARYREELSAGREPGEAVAEAIDKVGAAIAASAGTVIVGIGMLWFAEFRKLQEAGLAIAFCLVVMLVATLTLLPALLRLAGHRAFWPRRLRKVDAGVPDRATGDDRIEDFWEAIGRAIRKRPGRIAGLTLVVMAPFAAIAVAHYNELSFGLLSELPSGEPSVRGAAVLTKHFPAGATGSLTLLVENDRVDFRTDAGVKLLDVLFDRLKDRRESLGLADIRGVPAPLGLTKRGREAIPTGVSFVPGLEDLVRRRSVEHYVARPEALGGHVTRIDLLLASDPFSRAGLDRMETLDREVRALLPDGLREGTQIAFSGVTASLRDLRTVASVDRARINILVTLSVLAILVILLRSVALPVFLIVSVLFSFLVTLGVTRTLFRAFDPRFEGIDWTVPVFLFAVLVAVGEDYNIFFVTRVHEEQRRLGRVSGVIVALRKTGGIISGCGIIMAGTFGSLFFGGALASMYQLGFALAFGVLLDTFVIRPVVVPAYLILVNDGRLGRFGRLLGGPSAPGPDQSA